LPTRRCAEKRERLANRIPRRFSDDLNGYRPLIFRAADFPANTQEQRKNAPFRSH
jgi:hypothetical protein